jgi:hypothetical protein
MIIIYGDDTVSVFVHGLRVGLFDCFGESTVAVGVGLWWNATLVLICKFKA